MAEAENSSEEKALKVIQQHIVDAQQEEDSQQTTQEKTEQQVAIIITHSDSSNITKEESLSPKSSECHSVGVQTQTDPQPLYNVIPDDGSMGYDDGVRVLRAIGTWAPEYSGTAQFVENSSQGFVTGDKNGTSTSNLNGKAAITSSTSSTSNVTPAPKSSSSEKSFTCPVCNKGLARKDKLVIHMRIHTGEKPYVCEVCDKAFARRDKLVMHMNKLKHLTPTNIAPLGKRSNQSPIVTLTPVKKPAEIKTEKSPAAQSESLANELRALGQPRHVVAWSCEICGRLCSSRDEWAAHAKSHLNVGDAYNLSDRHACMVCRQEFSEKSELTFHMRQHISAKGEQIADLNSICS